MLSKHPYTSLVVGLHLVSEPDRTSAPKSHGPFVYTIMETGKQTGILQTKYRSPADNRSTWSVCVGHGSSSTGRIRWPQDHR